MIEFSGGGASCKPAPVRFSEYSGITKTNLLVLFFYKKFTRQNFAFTLSEVLITLGIIGIIAAMTLPAIIGNYNKKVTVQKLKQTYSILQQAVLLSQMENGEPREWNLTRFEHADSKDAIMEVCETYFIPYIKTVGEPKYMSLKEAGWKSYHLLSGQISNRPDIGTKRCIMKLNNGVSVMASLNSSGGENSKYVGMLFYIDINGPGKPNISGIDGFCIALYFENGSFTFWNMNAKRDILLKNYCTRTPGGENTSLGCGALILQDNWEIKDDYPW